MKINFTKVLSIAAGVASIVTPMLSSLSQKEELKKLVKEEVEKQIKNGI